MIVAVDLWFEKYEELLSIKSSSVSTSQVFGLCEKLFGECPVPQWSNPDGLSASPHKYDNVWSVRIVVPGGCLVSPYDALLFSKAVETVAKWTDVKNEMGAKV